MKRIQVWLPSLRLLLAGVLILGSSAASARQDSPSSPATSSATNQHSPSITLALAGKDRESGNPDVRIVIDAQDQPLSDAALFVDEELAPVKVEARNGTQMVRVPTGPGEHLITVSVMAGTAWPRAELQVTGGTGVEQIRPVVQVLPPNQSDELKSPDGTHIAQAHWGGVITMVEKRRGFINAKLRGHNDAIFAMAFSPGGKLLASAGADGTVRVWRAKDGVQLLSVSASPAARGEQGSWSPIRVTGVAISPNLRWLVGLEICGALPDRCHALGRDPNQSKLYFWDLATGKLIRVLDVPINSTLIGGIGIGTDQLLFSPDSALIGEERTGKLLHAADGKTISSFADCPGVLVGADGKRSITMLGIVGEQQVPVSAYPPSGQVLMPYRNDQPTAPAPVPLLPAANAFDTTQVNIDSILAAGFADDGSVELATRYTLFRLAADGSTENASFDSTKRSPDELIFLPHGKRVISTDYANLSKSHYVAAWDPETGKRVALSSPTPVEGHKELLHNGETTDLAASDDGQLAAVADSVTRVEVFSTATAEPIADLYCTDVPRSVAFSPDNSMIAVGYGGGKAATYKPGDPPPNDGSTAEDHSVTIWNVKSRHKVRTLAGHAPMTSAVAWSPDGKLIASSGEDRTLKLWDAESGKMLASTAAPAFGLLRFLRHSNVLIGTGGGQNSISLYEVPSLKLVASTQADGRATSIAINTAENRLLTTTSEGTALWQLAADGPKQLGSFMLFPDGGYIFYTPDGYYLNSGASRALAFAIGDRVVPFDEFDLRFNRPDLVLTRIGLGTPELIQGYATAYRNRVERSGIAEEVVTGKTTRPTVTITKVDRVDDNAILRIAADSSGAKLSRTYIWVNGVPAFGRSGIVSSQSEQSITVPLSAGANHIEVSVVDERGAESIRDATDMTLAPRAVGPQLHVLAVGVSQYQNNEFSLKYADHDATAIGSFFQEQRYKFSRVSLDVKTNNTASHDNILQALKAMRSVPPDDYVIISFAGHGLLDDKFNFYFAPYDMDFTHPAARGISYKDLEEALYAIPSRHKVLLLDSCHSGEIRDEASTPASTPPASSQTDVPEKQNTNIVASPPVKNGARRGVDFDTVALNDTGSASYIEQLFADLRHGPGASILAASSAQQYSYESDKYDGGVFTYELIRCVRTGDADSRRDGEFHVSELRQCVANHVLEDTSGRQRPTARGRDPFDQSIAREDYLVRAYPAQVTQFVAPLATEAHGDAAAWNNTREIVVSDALSGKVLHNFKSPCSANLFVGITGDANYLATGCSAHFNEPQLAVWHLAGMNSDSAGPAVPTDSNCELAKETGEDGQASKSSAILCRLDVGNWQVVGGDQAPDGTIVLAVHTFSREKNTWISALEVWDAKSKKLVQTIPVVDLSFSPTVSVSPDHTLVIVNDAIGNAPRRLTVLDSATGQVLWQKESQYLIQTGFSSDSRQLAMASVAETPAPHERVQLVDARTGRETAAVDIPRDEEAVTAIAFAPDNSFLAIGMSRSGSREQSVDNLRFMTVPGLKTIDRSLPQSCPVRTIGFAAAGARIITGCGKSSAIPSEPSASEFRIWDSAQFVHDLQLRPR